MARPLYSARLFTAPSFSGGPSEVFTTPDGLLAVVRTISIVYGDVTVSGLDAWVQYSDLTKLVRATFAEGLTATIGGVSLFNGHWGVPAGETLSIQTVAGTADFHASGYLLTAP